jgi:hypothetical protein
MTPTLAIHGIGKPRAQSADLNLTRRSDDNLGLAAMQLNLAGQINRLARESIHIPNRRRTLRKDDAGEGVVGIRAAHINEGHAGSRV